MKKDVFNHAMHQMEYRICGDIHSHPHDSFGSAPSSMDCHNYLGYKRFDPNYTDLITHHAILYSFTLIDRGNEVI